MNDQVNTTIYCHRPFQYKKLAGQKYLYSPRECFNDLADYEGYCRGKTVGSSCSNNGHADCDVDSYCEATRKICVPAGRVGDSCTSDMRCASHLLCAFENGVEYKCRNYGTYPNGKILGPGDEDSICQSNYKNYLYYCSEGPRLTSPHLRDNENEQCHYTAGDSQLSQCWYHAEGKAICRTGVGDLMKEWNTILAYLLLMPKCHVSIPLAQCDMGRKVVKSDEEWKQIKNSIIRLHCEPQLEGLASCMKQYIHPDFDKFGDNSENS